MESIVERSYRYACFDRWNLNRITVLAGVSHLTFPHNFPKIDPNTANPNPKGLSMKGNIYTQQKCHICGGKMTHDERRNGCFCTKHPEVEATKKFRVKYGAHIDRRKPSYIEASRLLNRLRAEDDEGLLDVRDHMASRPLAFDKQARAYLKFKEKQNLKSFYHVECYMLRAPPLISRT